MADNSSSARTLAAGAARISKRLVASYLLDWILIFGLAGIGGGFNKGVTHTNHRPFSLQDPSISYPQSADTVTVSVLIIVSLLVPLIITAIVSLVFVPGPTAAKGTPKSLIWRRKLWELNTAWMGVGLSCALAFMATEGLKNLAGKPRPYAIHGCNPDLSNIDAYRVGGLGTGLTETGATPILVSYGICQERDTAVLREIFASWPSGHSSFSWAGLLYLTLFLSAKFAVGVPYLTPHNQKSRENTYEYDVYLRDPSRRPHSPDSHSTSATQNMSNELSRVAPPPRNSSAAPPIYLLILAVVVPIGTAIFICVSRWYNYKHHGIDILSGAAIGAFTAYFAFRYYHMPIRRGNGWSWGARSRDRAFWLGVGRDGYVGDEGWLAKKSDGSSRRRDVESGKPGVPRKDAVTGPGIHDTGDVDSTHGLATNDVNYTSREQGRSER